MSDNDSQQDQKVLDKVLDDEILDSMIYEVYGTNGWKQAAVTKSDDYENDDFCGGTGSFGKHDSRVLSDEDDLWPMSDNEKTD